MSEKTKPQRIEERIEVLDAMIIAAERKHELLDVLAPTMAESITAVMDHFGFTQAQAYAVLDLQVRRLTDESIARTRDDRDSQVGRL